LKLEDSVKIGFEIWEIHKGDVLGFSLPVRVSCTATNTAPLVRVRRHYLGILRSWRRGLLPFYCCYAFYSIKL
jgi:hypothetical protein